MPIRGEPCAYLGELWNADSGDSVNLGRPWEGIWNATDRRVSSRLVTALRPLLRHPLGCGLRWVGFLARVSEGQLVPAFRTFYRELR